MSEWVITYQEFDGGPMCYYGPVEGTPFDAYDHMSAAYARVGLTCPGHIFQFKSDE